MDKADFQSPKLSLVDRIKLKVLNAEKDSEEDYFMNRIVQWSNLAFLNRVVIIMKDEASSKVLYDFLKQLDLRHDIKINLQENLISRLKSVLEDEESLNTKGLRKFKASNINYQEPEPQKVSSEDLNRLGYSDSKTLYSPRKKPSLSINTGTSDRSMSLDSPTITLDES